MAAHAARELDGTDRQLSAVVGGVSTTLLPDTTAMFAAAGMLAADGRRAPPRWQHILINCELVAAAQGWLAHVLLHCEVHMNGLQL